MPSASTKTLSSALLAVAAILVAWLLWRESPREDSIRDGTSAQPPLRQPELHAPPGLPAPPAAIPNVAPVPDRCALLETALRSHPNSASLRKVLEPLGRLRAADLDCLALPELLLLAARACDPDALELGAGTDALLTRLLRLEIAGKVGALPSLDPTQTACLLDAFPVQVAHVFWARMLLAVASGSPGDGITRYDPLMQFLKALMAVTGPAQHDAWRPVWLALQPDMRGLQVKYNWYLAAAESATGLDLAGIVAEHVAWEDTSSTHGNLALSAAARGMERVQLALRGELMRQAANTNWRRVLLLSFPGAVQWPQSTMSSGDMKIRDAIRAWSNQQPATPEERRLQLEIALNRWQLLGPDEAIADLADGLPKGQTDNLTAARVGAAMQGIYLAEARGEADYRRAVRIVEEWVGSLDVATLIAALERMVAQRYIQTRGASEVLVRVLGDRIGELPPALATGVQVK